LSNELADTVGQLVEDGIAERMFPGAVVRVSRGGEVVCHEVFGRTRYEAGSRSVQRDDLFDLASLTKLFTTTVVLRLAERGVLDLDDPVRVHVPEVAGDWTVEDLLAHRTGTTAGLLGHAVRCGVRPCEAAQEDALWSAIFGCGGEVPLAEGECHYSDIDLLLAQAVCERATGLGLAELVRREVTEPLGLHATGFCPPDPSRCVPTEFDERWRRRLVVGEVHDEMAHTLGGVAGHAGLFATAADVGRFGEAWLGVGAVPVLSDDMRHRAFRPHSARFGLGWVVCNAASTFPSLEPYGAVGHLGFTGTSVHLFPSSGAVLVVLTNRVYPHRDAAPSRLPLLRRLADLVACGV